MKILFVLALLSSTISHASAPIADDSDLSPPRLRTEALLDVPSTLAPDKITAEGDAKSPEIQAVLHTSNGDITLEGISWNIGGKSPSCDISAELRHDKFVVDNGQGTAYTIRFSADCSKKITVDFNDTSNAGQAMGIYRIGYLAFTKLSKTVDMKFWNSRVRFAWPAEADFYSYGTVHITDGKQWDVVGHELGHAIYDLGNIGEFGGGTHYIDKCYSDELALSEGWASFFSAWLSVDLRDTDAKFQYMVPRRAPIRFENIPADVCRGQGSEWRVTGFFWDLIDLNRDGENAEYGFAQAWSALLNKKVSSAQDARQELEHAGIDRDVLNIVWSVNF